MSEQERFSEGDIAMSEHGNIIVIWRCHENGELAHLATQFPGEEVYPPPFVEYIYHSNPKRVLQELSEDLLDNLVEKFPDLFNRVEQ